MSDNPPTQPPNQRQRGAQSGNNNALKHGFYAGHFRRADIKALESSNFKGLQDEIDLMRMFIRRVIEKTDPDSPLSEDLEVLRTLSFASICLTRLVRTHLIALPETNAMDELNEALRKMVEDMKADPKSLLPYDPQHPVY